MEGFLIFLLILVLLPYLLIRLLPYLLKWWLKSNNATNVKQKEKLVTKDMGEYVDFEEVKEERNGDL